MKITELTSNELGEYAERHKVNRTLHQDIEKQFNQRIIWVKDKRGVCSHCGAVDLVEQPFKNGDTKVCYKCGSQCRMHKLRKNTNFNSYREDAYARVIRRVDDVIIQTTYKYQMLPTNDGEKFGYMSVEHLFLQGRTLKAVSWGTNGFDQTINRWKEEWVPRRYSYQSWLGSTKYAHQDWNDLFTPNLKYCQFDKYVESNHVDSPIDALHILAKYPMLEMVWKMGMKKLYGDFVEDLKYKREAVKALKHYRKQLMGSDYRMFEIANALTLVETDGISFELATQYAMRVSAHRHNELHKYASIKPIAEIIKYIVKNDAYNVYFDYLSMMDQLKTPVDENTIFPKDIHKAHNDATSKLNAVKYEKHNGKYAKRLGKLTELNYAAEGLMVVVPTKLEQILVEGKALSHCVGSYIDRVSEGETTILFVRTQSDPEKPYYTMEWKDRVIQLRGEKNKPAPDDVKAFVDRWEKKMTKKERTPRFEQAFA